MPHIEAITTELPVSLGLIDFADEHLIQQISDGKQRRVEEEIKRYFFEEYGTPKESFYTFKDVYLKTILIENASNQALYWITFRHLSGKVNSYILFWNKEKKSFSKYIHDFNIHGLYVEKDGKLESSDLKEKYELSAPEIELVDFDGDEFPDFKLKRLYHNGTSNSIEEMIVEVKNNEADTLNFARVELLN